MSNFFETNGMFSRLMGMFMVFVFAGLGLIFLFVPVLWENFTGTNRKILGVALILYAGFRLYRVFRAKKEYDE